MMRLKIFLTLVLLCLVTQGAGAWTGSGSEADPYRISTVYDWNTLCTNVSLGESYNGKHFLMTRSISVSRVVGAHPGTDVYNAFGGIFDGGGNTLTINYTTDAEFCGPFCYTYGATTPFSVFFFYLAGNEGYTV